MAHRKIVSADRLTNSVVGNPRFRVHFSDGSSAITMSDASASYDVENCIGKAVDVEFTRAGRIRTISEVK